MGGVLESCPLGNGHRTRIRLRHRLCGGDAYADGMSKAPRARVGDVHDLAGQMPHVTIERGSLGNPVSQIGGKLFVFFRNPRSDATDPETGERYPDVIVFWVPSESDMQAMVNDPASAFFTTAHFGGHRSVLLRCSSDRRTHSARTDGADSGRLAHSSFRAQKDGLDCETPRPVTDPSVDRPQRGRTGICQGV